ncbi:ATP-grasp domain-containing protein [Phytoactinopolyspora alkaliphila]|uniref:ATP-grasp domain-containing protein n=1 Tax=Phytoactinopolyspora alkaliphila TaxID=1783498 RepID=A0A6N9YLZ9_9ACTN|nr:ATP-grasp domain-containing protein [Phytoactinopolyspora alkaliphila]NED95957.1 ATP-grasp domain-containing protein [Phytoactinopolyspora alkaliphila]
MPKNVFVLGLDDLNAATLHSLPDADQYRFHQLLAPDELLTDDIQLMKLLASAERQLYEFDGTIDAIIGYWDFPVSSLVPLLCHRFGTTGPDLESVVKCEHKYWSRLEQQQVIDELPRFDIVDPHEVTAPPPGWDYPFWIKPIKSVSSAFAYKVRDDAELTTAVRKIRENIDWMGAPFQAVLDHVDAPPGIATSARACLVEEDVSGTQVTVEGYAAQGSVHVYGVVESINYSGTSSFLRYQYPASLPERVCDRLADISTRVIEQIELDNVTFNIEYFWDPDTDAINLVEINPRHSQSHARLFQMVDGWPNHLVELNVALGHPSVLPKSEGEHKVAAKWFLRRFDDGMVRRVPTEDAITDLGREVPGATVNIVAKEGCRLSELTHQDSYSFELAEIIVGGDNDDELSDKYERCVAALPFDIEP